MLKLASTLNYYRIISNRAFGIRAYSSLRPKKIENNIEYYEIDGKQYIKDEYSNVSENIINKIYKQIHNKEDHPIERIKRKIQNSLIGYQHFNEYSPIVKSKQNFDDLLVQPDHPGRSKSDSFYFNKEWMLRTHTTTNELDVYKLKDVNMFTICADVYRRDEIDKSHYPAFHQLEVVKLISKQDINKLSNHMHQHPLIKVEDPTLDLKQLSQNNPIQKQHIIEQTQLLSLDLKNTINKLLFNLFGNQKEPLNIRWIEAFFPFTSPSWEVEIFYRNQWLEVMGSGILRQDILDNNGREGQLGWACGFGLERLSMVLHDIQDIRMFWSQDNRFLNQFKNQDLNQNINFVPFSKFPPCIKDITFWIPNGFEENDFCELVRECAGDLVESVELIDDFIHPKTKRNSKCYRIIYRSMDRNVTNQEINEIQAQVRERVEKQLLVELR